MLTVSKPRDLKKLRRLALYGQGLTTASAFGHGHAAALSAIEHLGYVQLDSISVIERAHNHTWFSRVPNFNPGLSNDMLEQGEIYEYWAHAAAYMPMRDFRFSLIDKARVRAGEHRSKLPKDTKLMNKVMQRIRIDGPMSTRDLETPRTKRSGWWDWKPAKKAAERLYLQGDLMICSRAGFQKTYDLTERVLPSSAATIMPSLSEWANHLIDEQLNCHSLVTLPGITYSRRHAGLTRAVKAEVLHRLAMAELQQVQLPNNQVYYSRPGLLDQPLPRVSSQLQILSPFDNLVIQRARLHSLFNFDYQIECYVPAAKRRYGYFALPLLYRDELVGRIDCKAHRAQRHLALQSVHLQCKEADTDSVCRALAAALPEFAKFQDCDTVSCEQVSPRSATRVLQRALARHF
ncbi:MAG: hypothetical protein CMP86_06000 [Gammaproteobacteria bacterium]|nr:hypothetical protein [Gammaproteobacteria bacterium]